MHGMRLVAKHDRVIEDAARHGWAAFEPESMAAWLAVARKGAISFVRHRERSGHRRRAFHLAGHLAR